MANITKDEEVKAAILEAAKRVFQKWGFSKTTMEDIAHEAGKGKSTLYYYFKSKDDIFREFTINELDVIIGKAKDSTAGVSSAKEKLKTYVSTILIEMKNTISLFPLIKGEIKGNAELTEQLLNLLHEKEEAIVLEILKQGLASGEFHFLNKKNLVKAANVLVGMSRGLALYLFVDNEDSEKMDLATRFISNGI